MAAPRAVAPEMPVPRKPTAPATAPEPTPIDLGEESVAGEEDPGAALDVDAEPALPGARIDQRRPTTSG
jgi:hypothetical protein